MRLGLVNVIAITMFIIAYRVKKSQHERKGVIFSVLVTAALVVMLAGSMNLIGQFYSFESPEKAFQYEYDKDVINTIYGQNTAYVVASAEQSIYIKVEDGWKLSKNSYKKSICIVDKCTVISIHGYRDIEDNYIWISGNIEEDFNVKDNLDTKFILKIETFEEYNWSNRYYFAYVEGMDEEYVLDINGKEYKVSEFDEYGYFE